MTIYYLMVKTHKITGLKYLCQTKRKDPYKYLGSGEYWNSHLRKHGKTIMTDIIHECETKEELSERGLYYSNIWDVVNAKDEFGKKIWANLKPESGDGGWPVATDAIITKRLLTRTLNGTINTTTPDSIARRVATRKAGKGYVVSAEMIDKANATKTRNNTFKRTPESIIKGITTKAMRGTGKSTPEANIKRVETRRANGKHRGTPKATTKRFQTLKETGAGIYNKIECPHCKKVIGKPMYMRWHGDNCKINII
jgi:hypothetical protein